MQRTQQLYDAVANRNQAPWRQYFADDCIFSDEKGRTMDKSKLVADIAPITDRVLRRDSARAGAEPDYEHVAIPATMLTKPRPFFFGQKLTARYHITDTWMCRGGNWQIVASHAPRYYEDPAVRRADPAKFNDFAGTCELAPGQTRTVLA